ncbi:ASCH domain-containing protein [Patescibacteria group bacterium]|nr:ASCH domain-containing protein [Patescibacteria group bacterium]MCL5410055.1 ASCH domain-containing protein [Patescibacteria group bacterium]
MPQPQIHIAIMRKSWGLTHKILSGEKTVESRWYTHHYPPWGRIKSEDVIYFKDSGEPITIKATVANVLQFDHLTPVKVQQILHQYAQADGLGIKSSQLTTYYEIFKNKRCCLIIFLKDAQAVPPFQINKTGFGAMAAWLIVDNLKQISKI